MTHVKPGNESFTQLFVNYIFASYSCTRNNTYGEFIRL